MIAVLQEVPVQAALYVPLARLRKFPAHEQQLGPGVGVHVPVEQAQIGEALPLVAGHPVQKAPFSMYYLIVRKRQHEVFRKRINQAEGELPVVVAAVNRIFFEVVERVVHPSHHPLLPKAQPTRVGWPRYARPGSGFLGHGEGVGKGPIYALVELAQKGNGLDIFLPPVLVRDPLSFFPGVIEVEHRGYSIHAQPVGMVLADPK